MNGEPGARPDLARKNSARRRGFRLSILDMVWCAGILASPPWDPFEGEPVEAVRVADLLPTPRAPLDDL